MLHLLQLKVSALFCLLLMGIFLIIPLGDALEIGIYPPKLEFNSSIGQYNCKNLYLFSDRFVVMQGEFLWSEFESKDLKDYNLNYNFIELEYEKTIGVNGESKVKVCLKSDRVGEYYGVVYYKLIEGNVGVGSWINFNVIGEKSWLETNFIERNLENNNLWIILLGELAFLEFLGLFLLLVYRQKRFIYADE